VTLDRDAEADPDHGRDGDRDQDDLGVLDQERDDVGPSFGEVLKEVHGVLLQWPDRVSVRQLGVGGGAYVRVGLERGPEESVEQSQQFPECGVIVKHVLGVSGALQED